MDLSRQDTFTRNSGIEFISIGDGFKLRSHKGVDFMSLWMYNEFFKNWVYCCRIDTLEELETEYNKRSNRLFAWKSPSKSRVSYSWLVTS